MWAAHRGDADGWRAVVGGVKVAVAQEEAADDLVVGVVEVAIGAGLVADPVAREALVYRLLQQFSEYCGIFARYCGNND